MGIGLTCKELTAIKDKAGDELEDMTEREAKVFTDAFNAARDEGDTIDEAIDYALDVYEDE